jgi:hypothetical protein
MISNIDMDHCTMMHCTQVQSRVWRRWSSSDGQGDAAPLRRDCHDACHGFYRLCKLSDFIHAPLTCIEFRHDLAASTDTLVANSSTGLSAHTTFWIEIYM